VNYRRYPRGEGSGGAVYGGKRGKKQGLVGTPARHDLDSDGSMVQRMAVLAPLAPRGVR